MPFLSGVRFGYFAHRPKVRFLPGTLKPCLRSPWSSAHKDMDKNEEVSGREKNAKMCKSKTGNEPIEKGMDQSVRNQGKKSRRKLVKNRIRHTRLEELKFTCLRQCRLSPAGHMHQLNPTCYLQDYIRRP